MRRIFTLIIYLISLNIFAQYIGDPSFELDTLSETNYGIIPRSSPWKPINGTYIGPNVLICKPPFLAVDGLKYLSVFPADQAGVYTHQKLAKALQIGKEYEMGLYLSHADTSKFASNDVSCDRELGWTYLEVYFSLNNSNTVKYIQIDSAVVKDKRKVWRSPKIEFKEWRHFKFRFIADSAYQYIFLYNTPNQLYYPFLVDYVTFRAMDEPEPEQPRPTGIDDLALSGESLWSLSPNPFADVLKLSLAKGQAARYWKVKMVNPLGREVYVQTLSEAETVLDLNMLSNGLYTVSLESETGRFVSKRIVKY